MRMTKRRWFSALALTVAASAACAYVLNQSGAHSKSIVLRGSARDQMHAHGKGGGSLVIDISAPSRGDGDAGSAIELVARVEALEDLQGLEYSWLLPAGIEIQSGAVQGHLGDLRRGETTTLNITVLKATKARRQVHLHVFRNTGTKDLGQIAQYDALDSASMAEEEDMKAAALRERSPASDEDIHDKADNSDHHFRLMQ